MSCTTDSLIRLLRSEMESEQIVFCSLGCVALSLTKHTFCTKHFYPAIQCCSAIIYVVYTRLVASLCVFPVVQDRILSHKMNLIPLKLQSLFQLLCVSPWLESLTFTHV